MVPRRADQAESTLDKARKYEQGENIHILDIANGHILSEQC